MQRSRKSVSVSIITPAFNEYDNLERLCEAIVSALEPTVPDFDILVVDNGSTDGSKQLLAALREKDPRIGFVSLSRNFGHQGGLIAGLEYSRGDLVISMDADFQHPPTVLVELIEKWEEGFDIVGTKRNSTEGTGVIRNAVNRVYYSFLSRLMGNAVDPGQSDFRLMDRRALTALLALPEQNKFIRGLAAWVGFKQAVVEYKPQKRLTGQSKFSSSQLFRFSISGVTAFSLLPLRLFALIGSLIATLAVLYSLYLLISTMLIGSEAYPEGWVTLAVGVSFFGGVQLLGIGVLGEYLGRTLEQARDRPAYIVSESSLTNEINPTDQSR